MAGPNTSSPGPTARNTWTAPLASSRQSRSKNVPLYRPWSCSVISRSRASRPTVVFVRQVAMSRVLSMRPYLTAAAPPASCLSGAHPSRSPAGVLPSVDMAASKRRQSARPTIELIRLTWLAHSWRYGVCTKMSAKYPESTYATLNAPVWMVLDVDVDDEVVDDVDVLELVAVDADVLDADDVVLLLAVEVLVVVVEPVVVELEECVDVLVEVTVDRLLVVLVLVLVKELVDVDDDEVVVLEVLLVDKVDVLCKRRPQTGVFRSRPAQ